MDNQSVNGDRPWERLVNSADNLNMPELSESAGKLFNGVELVQHMCKSFWFCRSALTSFAAASIAALPACKVEENPGGSLWPIPPQVALDGLQTPWTATTP